eukprot:1637307-Amphidinium_carterae.1
MAQERMRASSDNVSYHMLNTQSQPPTCTESIAEHKNTKGGSVAQCPLRWLSIGMGHATQLRSKRQH